MSVEEEKKRASEKVSSAHKYAGAAGALAAGVTGALDPHTGGAAAHVGLEAIKHAKHAQIDAKHSDDPQTRAIGEFLEWDAPETSSHPEIRRELERATFSVPNGLLLVTAARGILKLFS